jgi:signal recognition particle receptor subunit beta
MAVFNYAKKEIDAKIVYYGPAISGKTTNLQFIHQHLKVDQRGKLVSLATNEDRTLFFDFLPIELESVRGFRTRFHLYTVPGQVYYGATRRAVLTGADGVVFVADSHADRMEDNLTSFKDLEDNLRYYGKKAESIPLILQYNKRDLPDILSVEELNQKINRLNSPYFEAVAILGKGVFETLTMTCRLVLKAIESGVESRRTPNAAEKSPTPISLRGQRTEKTAQPQPSQVKGMKAEGALQLEPAPSPAEEAPARTMLLDEEGSRAKVAHRVQDTPRAKGLRQEKEAGSPELSSVGKIRPVRVEGIDAEKKPDAPAPVGLTLGKKKQDSPFKFEKGVGKTASVAKETVRILSCGQPRLSSSNSFEIPLTLEVEGSEKTFPLDINLSIKLDQIDPKVD